ncbi:sigma 54-interacting transcriptional regulator, partial [Thiococcus pfennigii]|uniref:sigma-54-dependent Fis family transcriptional regulator n=1 Tax=Thiococcus pfennigii TaxID=1057 RepID=UPI0019055E66
MNTQATKHVDQPVLHEIFKGVAAETGEAFFDALVRHLAGALDVQAAWVTEWLPDESLLRALSFWSLGRHVPGYEYRIQGTPCEAVIFEQRLVVVPNHVIDLYPADPDLAPMGAVSYMGLPLRDADGQVLGNLAVLDGRPLEIDATRQAVFSIFGARAAAELGRLRRDRALRESEQQLSRLIDSAMDSIIELDATLRVIRLNRAAAGCFGCSSEGQTSQPMERLFAAESCARLRHLTQCLRSGEVGGDSLWIPEGLQGLKVDGKHFSAEATLSRFESGGKDFFTLILRNVEERLAAEARLQALTDETSALRAELDALRGFDEIIGNSPGLRRLLEDIERVAPSEVTVLITGETGTGKELIARAIHRRSRRRDCPLIKVNCAAIAASLQESEFFGHEKGAFTGATQRREGRFQLADGGTLFLDELGEMPLDLQAKLLRVLQEGEFEPVGSGRTVRIDVRVIAATNRDLIQMVKDGRFREDLLYRLNVFPIHAPPLRERGDDVVLLAEAIAARVARQDGTTHAPLSAADRERLKAYAWPGNVRELENLIERAWIHGTDTASGRILNLARALPDATPK